VVGPSLAGGLIALGDYGMEAVFYLVALCYIGFIAQLWKLPATRRISRAAKAPFMQQLTGGISYIIRTPALAALIGLAFVPILFGMPYQTLLPVFTERSLHVGAAQLGVLSAASGVGALVGSLTVASLGGFKRRDLLQVGFGVIFGLALVGFALMPFLLASIVWIFLVGLAGNAYMALNSSMIMSTTERAYHGRVMSVYMMTWSLMPLSSLPLGKVVDAAGIEATMAVMGVIVALFVAAVGATRLRRPAPVTSGVA
jgi:hypothetical protein